MVQAAAARHRVLVIDDSPVHRAILRDLLAQDGYEVLDAADGIAGIGAALEWLPDLVISDVMMPDISGYQVCRFLKHDPVAARIPIVLMTATELSQRHRFWGLRSGADHYVPKEHAGDQLRVVVASLLRSIPPGSVRAWARGQLASRPRERDVRSELPFLLDQLLFHTTIAQEVLLLGTYVHDADKWLGELARLVGDLTDYACLCVHLAGADGSRLYVATRHPLSAAQLQQTREVAAEQFGRADPLADVPGIFHPPAAGLLNPELRTGRFPALCAHGLQTSVSRLGSIAFYFDAAAAMTSEVRDQLAMLAREFGPIAHLAVTYREMQQLSVVDNLTLLFHERHFREQLGQAFERLRQSGRSFAVMLVDVDYLERLNERYGHATGDAVLRQLALLLRSHMRSSDLVARSGDDELAVLLPDTPLDAAGELAEDYRGLIARTPFGSPDAPVRVTVSIGLAAASPTAAEGSTVYWEANAAVCEAKQAGRNAVRAFRA